MQVELAGRVAQVAGPQGPVRAAVASALAANGAALADDGADIVVVDARAATSPDHAIGLAQAASALMTGGGRVVLLVDASGVVAMRGALAQSAAAAGLISATKVLAMQCAATGVLVNAVACGALDGDATAARVQGHAPLRRAVSPQDIAGAVLFLADPDNSYTTGHVLTVDGGWSAGFARDF